jgi:hypothetical protein
VAIGSRRIALVGAGVVVAVGVLAVLVSSLLKQEQSGESIRPSSEEAAPRTPSVDSSSLPSRERPAEEPPVGAEAVPAVRDPALAAFVNPNLSVKERISGDISTRLPKVRYPEDTAIVVGVLKNPEEDDVARNEAANLLRRSGYAGLIDCLKPEDTETMVSRSSPIEGLAVRSRLGTLWPALGVSFCFVWAAVCADDRDSYTELSQAIRAGMEIEVDLSQKILRLRETKEKVEVLRGKIALRWVRGIICSPSVGSSIAKFSREQKVVLDSVCATEKMLSYPCSPSRNLCLKI